MSTEASLIAEGYLDPADALDHVSPAQFAAATRPAASSLPDKDVLGRGLGVSPGTASGVATFDAADAVERSQRGESVVFIRVETRPEDLPALLAAGAFVTTRGGRTSHAAVVARAVGRPCVVGLADATVDPVRRVLDVGGVTIADGDLITVDGTGGVVAAGNPGSSPAAGGQQLDQAWQALLAAADACRRMEVWANADTADAAAAARRGGATGIGLCRTEHMFLGDRQRLLAEILLSSYDSTAQESLSRLHELQRDDFIAILTAMDGLPVTIRLLDPPRHEFLPDLTELSVAVAISRIKGDLSLAAERRLLAVRRKAERNPMLGVRGVRLGLILPWLYEMQITALLEATLTRLRAGGHPRPMLLVPMVSAVSEVLAVRAFTGYLTGELQPLADGEISLPVGAMVETPRAALIAGELAEVADFFSFGTNDLTQLTWGLSRDDTDTEVLAPYQDLGLVDSSPFERLDRSGVGQLIELAVRAGRQVRPGMSMGACGEHAADPDSILAFDDYGLDYVSCAVPDITLARYAAGYAARRSARAGAGRPGHGRRSADEAITRGVREPAYPLVVASRRGGEPGRASPCRDRGGHHCDLRGDAGRVHRVVGSRCWPACSSRRKRPWQASGRRHGARGGTGAGAGRHRGAGRRHRGARPADGYRAAPPSHRRGSASGRGGSSGRSRHAAHHRGRPGSRQPPRRARPAGCSAWPAGRRSCSPARAARRCSAGLSQCSRR